MLLSVGITFTKEGDGERLGEGATKAEVAAPGDAMLAEGLECD